MFVASALEEREMFYGGIFEKRHPCKKFGSGVLAEWIRDPLVNPMKMQSFFYAFFLLPANNGLYRRRLNTARAEKIVR